ncbi:MAG: inositol monophosphatase [Actinobacteria bacterium]|nr:inositol monophosphatase [Actinomycetota bacterium]
MAVELARIAVDLARRAGALVADGRARAGGDRAGLGVRVKSTPTDVVTVMDRVCEDFLVDELRRLRPQDAVVGEEGGTRADGAAPAGPGQVRWLVDPIDGTVNYIYGVPQYAVSVAAERGGTVVAGAVHNPASGETFWAWLDGGAYLSGGHGGEGQRLRVTSCSDLGQALVGTGFGYSAAVRAEQARAVAELLPLVRDIRRLGSAALDLCFLAAGRLDAYYEARLYPWDYAAGALIAAEAGAWLAGLHGQPAGDDFVAAAAPGVAEAFFALLESLHPVGGSGR